MDHLSHENVYAYGGLELATFITRLFSIEDYWCRTMFVGKNDSRSVMSRATYKHICVALLLYPCYDHETAFVDPLWHRRIMMEHIQRNATTMAVPIGVVSSVEGTIRSKGRTAARTYMKSKPV